MRRFNASLVGRIFSHFVVLALLLPTLTLALYSRATAQVATPTDFVAVVEFNNKKEPTGTEYGARASNAIIGELGKINNPNVELIPQETVLRAITTLGVANPPAEFTNLLRVAQEARATKVITGDVVDYRILKSASGKQANVSVRVIVYDVASGLPVNGAAVMGTSTVRPDATEDKLLINDAILQAASTAVREIGARVLPYGTVLNTTTNEALVNQGTRTGFRAGQNLIVKRFGIQVATAKVVSVDADSSVIKPERVLKGIKPGDRVEAIFDVPNVLPGFTATGPKTVNARKGGSSSGLITTLLVLGLLAFLVHGGGTDGGATVEAGSYTGSDIPLSTSAIKIDWTHGFERGNNVVAMQIWRSDFSDAPVAVTDGDPGYYIMKSTDTGAFSWTSGTGPNGSCVTFRDSAGTIRPVVTGAAYQFSLNWVRHVEGPPQNTTATTATGTTATATGTTTTATTATASTATATTATGGGPSADLNCYVVGDRVSARGLATALLRPTLSSPADQAEIQGNQVFAFAITASTAFSLQLEAKLEFSDTNTFPKSRTYTAGKKSVTVGAGSFPAIDVSASGLPSYIKAAKVVYWRVGIKNTQDKPGPFPERSDWDRYVFSPARAYKPPVGPPPPP